MRVKDEVRGLDHFARTLDDSAFDDVLELPHVSRPVTGDEEVQGLMAHPEDAGALQRQPLPVDEVAHEQRDVFPPLPQRWEKDLEHLQAMEQVVPEGPGSHARGKIGVAGGDQAKVAVDRAAAADSSKLALLQHAQELCLRLEGPVRDLVPEKGAAVPELEDAHPPAVGAGEGARFVAGGLAL